MPQSVMRFDHGDVTVTAKGPAESKEFQALIDRLALFFGDVTPRRPRNASQSQPPIKAPAPRALMKIVRPTSAVEAATVFAVAAAEAGLAGVSRAMAEEWADASGFPQQPDWSRTFINARRSGLIRNARYGYWEPTEEGRGFVNDARYIAKHRPNPRRRQKEVKPTNSSRKK